MKKMIVIRDLEFCDEDQKEKIIDILDMMPIKYEIWESEKDTSL